MALNSLSFSLQPIITRINYSYSPTICMNKACNNSLFSLMERGQKAIGSVHQQAIVLVGGTRSGSSTVFNWAARVAMLGNDSANSAYTVYNALDSNAAAVASSFSSVTLVPNIHNIQEYEPKLSLVDMPGFGNTNGYVDKMCANYFFKLLFDRARKVKFVIVVDESKLYEQPCDGLIKACQGFINMFDLSLINERIKRKIINSVSMVITKAKKPENHWQYLNQILKKLQNPFLFLQNKKLISQLLLQIVNSARHFPFKEAIYCKNPEKCLFIEKFNQLGWQFLNLDQWKPDLAQEIVQIPILREFQNMPVEFKDAFRRQMMNKVTNFLSFSTILRSLLKNIEQQWHQKLNLGFRNPSFHLFFGQVKAFNLSNDVYEDQQYSLYSSLFFSEPSLIQCIKKILKLSQMIQGLHVQGAQEYKISWKTGSFNNLELELEQIPIENSKRDKFEIIKQKLTAIINQLKYFASSYEQEMLLERTKYVIRRGFREFQQLWELSDSIVEDANFKLINQCQSLFQGGFKMKFMDIFLKQTDQKILLKWFSSPYQLQQYEELFSDFQTLKEQQRSSQLSNKQSIQTTIMLNNCRNAINMAKIELVSIFWPISKTLLFYTSLYSVQQSLTLSQGNLNEEEWTQKLINITRIEDKILKKIVSLLKKSAQSQALITALQLAKHQCINEQAYQIYQILIELAETGQKLTIYSQYAEYCASSGALERGYIALDLKMSLEIEFQIDCSQTKEHMIRLLSQYQTYEKMAADQLKQAKKTKEKDQQLSQLLLKIQNYARKKICQIDQRKRVYDWL